MPSPLLLVLSLSRLPLLLVISLLPLLLRRHGVGSVASPLYSLACLSRLCSLEPLLLVLSLAPLLLVVRDRMVVWGWCGGGMGGVA